LRILPKAKQWTLPKAKQWTLPKAKQWTLPKAKQPKTNAKKATVQPVAMRSETNSKRKTDAKRRTGAASNPNAPPTGCGVP
jgi:hypothetical protein